MLSSGPKQFVFTVQYNLVIATCAKTQKKKKEYKIFSMPYE